MQVRLGPAFVKIGQALSSRPDVLPPLYITALELLQVGWVLCIRTSAAVHCRWLPCTRPACAAGPGRGVWGVRHVSARVDVHRVCVLGPEW